MRRSSRVLQPFDQAAEGRTATVRIQNLLGEECPIHAHEHSTFAAARSSCSGSARHQAIEHELDHEHRDTRGADIAQLLDSVHLLEAAAIALAAVELTPPELGRLHDVNAELRTSDAGTAARLARRFHESLLRACPNARMLELLGQQVSAASACGLTFAVDNAELDRVAAEHAVIIEMIAAAVPRRELERSLRRHAQTSPLCSMGY